MLRIHGDLARATLAALCLTAIAATAQGRGGPGGGGPPPPGGPGGSMNGGPMGGPGGPPGNRTMGSPGGPPPSADGRRPNDGPPPPGLRLGPPGRWWDDKSFVKSLKLRPDQQTRMDAIFEQNRSALTSRYQNLQQAEAQMADITRSPIPDEPLLLAQIDRVFQARADLEKVNAHLLLQIRREMDPDQIARLENHR